MGFLLIKISTLSKESNLRKKSKSFLHHRAQSFTKTRKYLLTVMGIFIKL